MCVCVCVCVCVFTQIFHAAKYLAYFLDAADKYFSETKVESQNDGGAELSPSASICETRKESLLLPSKHDNRRLFDMTALLYDIRFVESFANLR